ncbi:MAG: class GN sortase, partial [Chromatiales bacterium]|nr:class GN sortase [Chromatiales bacterium]
MRLRRLVAAAMVAIAIWHGGSAAALQAKALLAQVLLHDAWDAARAGERRPGPWPWADMWPVARLRFESRGEDLIVLSNASGRSLAFGPGVFGTVLPGDSGNSVVAGHRDTHFEFLRDVRPGDRFSIQRADGIHRAYRVESIVLADSRNARLQRGGNDALVTLVTCYPFGSPDTGGPLRYVVIARPDTQPRMHDGV